MVWYGMVWYGMVWYGTVWYGTVWYGTVRNGTVRYGMVWYATPNGEEMYFGMAWARLPVYPHVTTFRTRHEKCPFGVSKTPPCVPKIRNLVFLINTVEQPFGNFFIPKSDQFQIFPAPHEKYNITQYGEFGFP